MASTLTTTTTSSSSSYFQRAVTLQDWWLIKAEKDFEGKTLAVAGTSRHEQAVREFSSAPILKRYDVFTLETVDGIFVLIDGLINKVRTTENGFPSEVFKHFVFGFPHDWEKYAEKWVGGGFSNEDVSSTLDRDMLSTNSGVDDFPQSEVGLQQHMDDETEQMCENVMNQSSKESKNANKALKSSVGLGDANQKDDLQTVVSKKETNAKKASISRKKTKRKLTYESPVSQEGTEKTSFVSPESLSFKRSRSGRLLLPTLEFWRNQKAIYDADRQVTGIQGLHCVELSRGRRSEPRRK